MIKAWGLDEKTCGSELSEDLHHVDSLNSKFLVAFLKSASAYFSTSVDHLGRPF